MKTTAKSQEKEYISREAYEALKAIVGPEYITDDPVHCQAYNARGYGMERWEFLGHCTRPACVILPKTTEEVARIVRVCNRYEIPYVPAGAMFCMQSSPRFRQDFVTIDLKRMDKLEIDEKNMYAIVETGIIYGQLFEEAVKRDLYTLVPGGGSQVSVIANHLMHGMSPLGYRVGLSERRMNAMEWVSPEGDIVRMGARVIDQDSWYWQDGLGPNAIGLIRGYAGWNGAMGIVTKMSVKLYPFQPQRFEPEGISPDTHVNLPSRMKFVNITLPSEEALEKAMYEISHAQIGAALTKVPPSWRVIHRAKDRNEFWQEWQKVSPEQLAKAYILRVLLIGYTSEKQLEYEERVLTDIVNELGGSTRRTLQTDESLLKFSDSAGMWMMTGGFMSSEIDVESIRCSVKEGEILGKKQGEFVPPLMTNYGDIGWFQSLEFGHQGYFEYVNYLKMENIDPDSPQYNSEDVVRMWHWYLCETLIRELRTGLSTWCLGDTVPTRMAARGFHDFDIWIDRFKKEFDPKSLSNPVEPYAVDEIVKRHPEFITPEYREAITEVAERGKSSKGKK